MFTYKNLYSLGIEPGGSPGDIARFRRVAHEGFNISDMPDTRFFKLLFYFYNEDEETLQQSSGTTVDPLVCSHLPGWRSTEVITISITPPGPT